MNDDEEMMKEVVCVRVCGGGKNQNGVTVRTPSVTLQCSETDHCSNCKGYGVWHCVPTCLGA